MSYNANRNYAQEIKDAISNGASSSEVERLQSERNEKIAANNSHYSSIGVSANDRHGQSASDYISANDAAISYLAAHTGRGGGGSGNSSSSASSIQHSQGSYRGNDYTQYLKDLYAANTASQLAALKNAYDQNAADLQAQTAKIPQAFYNARNETAAQNELAKQSFHEYAASRGLNTGTSGQAALANSSALQKNLSTISTNEANALSETALAQQKLEAQYRNAMTQAQASGDSQLAQALYHEYIRQADAESAEQLAAQAQSNWEKQYQMQLSQGEWSKNQWQQEFDTSNSRWQQQFDYSKQSDAKNHVLTRLQMGIMPSNEELAAANISTADILNAKIASLQGSPTSYASSSSIRARDNRDTTGSKASPSKEAPKAQTDPVSKIADVRQLGTVALGIANSMSRSNSPSLIGSLAERISNALKSGLITDAEADFLMRAMGY